MYTDPKYINDLSGRTIGIKVVNGTDVTVIPLDENNVDYAEIMKLVADGTLTIAEADPITPLPT